MKTTPIVILLFFLLIVTLFAENSPNRMEIFYTPQKFIAHNDDLALAMPSLSEITIDDLIRDNANGRTTFVVDFLDVLWANYVNEPVQVTVVPEERTIIQTSGKITLSFEVSFLSDNSRHHCLHSVIAELSSRKITFNRTFSSDKAKHHVDVALFIEWDDIRLVDVGAYDITFWEELTRALNQTVKQKLGEAVTQQLLHKLSERYKAQGSKREASIYFVPHSSLMIELQNKLEIYEFSPEAVTFGREYSFAEAKIHDKAPWQPTFDPNLSDYQIALGKPLVEYLVRYAFEYDYFTYYFNAENSIPTSIRKTIGFNEMTLGLGDNFEEDHEKRTSMMCQLHMQQAPEITFLEDENLVKMPQQLLCGVVVTSFYKRGPKRMLKFAAEVVVKYEVNFNQMKHETAVKIEEIEVSDNVEILSPHGLLPVNADVIREWLVEGVQTLRGKMVQLGSGLDIPINNAQVYVKKDHLLFVGEPLKRLLNLYSADNVVGLN